MIATRDLQMEAYRKIDMLPDDDVRLIISIIDKINPSPAVIKAEDRKKRSWQWRENMISMKRQ
ncbi:hypothetical protein [Oribacterium sp. NK2B42]|uniref:hypothetical protein n=1 Tax=Oribacterium sp. NK2B42 TaxID=689781 RepID=UPI000492DD8A|nr:hypothetical protein [Oribacterium sp. NK2B42]